MFVRFFLLSSLSSTLTRQYSSMALFAVAVVVSSTMPSRNLLEVQGDSHEVVGTWLKGQEL